MLDLHPIHPSQHPIIMGPALDNGRMGNITLVMTYDERILQKMQCIVSCYIWYFTLYEKSMPLPNPWCIPTVSEYHVWWPNLGLSEIKCLHGSKHFNHLFPLSSWTGTHQSGPWMYICLWSSYSKDTVVTILMISFTVNEFPGRMVEGQTFTIGEYMFQFC